MYKYEKHLMVLMNFPRQDNCMLPVYVHYENKIIFM